MALFKILRGIAGNLANQPKVRSEERRGGEAW